MRKSIVAILVSVLLLSTAFCIQLASSVLVNPSSTLSSNPNSNTIATHGEVYLENVSGLLVLHVKGSPYEMGYQNGFLLKDHIQDMIQIYLYDDVINRLGYSYVFYCSQVMEPHIPQEYTEEMHGLADGANVNYTDILMLQTHLEAEFSCSGFAVFGSAANDGHLYHGRNEDWTLPGDNWSHGVVVVYEPESGNAFVNVGHFGFIGLLSGMNIKGVSLGLKASESDDRTLDGMPIMIMLRKVIQYSDNLSQAINIINQTDGTCGWNLVLGDGKNLNACAIETSDSYCKVFWAGDPAEDIPPHYSIENAVRRTNHYVDPELAATQRSPYDPRECGHKYLDSWERYEKLSQLIIDNYGNITAEMAIQFLGTTPVARGTLQSVVFDSTDLELWVANARGSTPAYAREYIHLSSGDLFPEPDPVGGYYIPVNKLELLAPYIALTLEIVLTLVATVVFIKHKKKKK